MENRAERAQSLHEKGYNCAQAVVCAYCGQFGVDEDTAFRMAEGLGFGMGLMETCGALTGAFLLAGLKNSKGHKNPGETKAETYRITRRLAAAFKEQNGTLLCRELKGAADGRARRSCPDCIADGCALVEKFLLD